MAATGTDLKYQWQIDRNDGKGFADIAGADRASYTTSAVDKNCNGYKYQCVIRNSAGSVTTGTANSDCNRGCNASGSAYSKETRYQ